MKILILILSCNKSPYLDSGNELKKSYKKLIKHYNLEDNIDIYDYVGEAKTLQFKDSTIYCKSKDGVFNSFSKTIECFNYIENNFNYDYIIRTNSSQFVNIKLMYNFILRINNDKYLKNIIFSNLIWCWLPNNMSPISIFNFMIEGPFIILSKYNIQKIINLSNKKNIDGLDDLVISNILMEHFKIQNPNDLTQHEVIKLFRSLGQGYYKHWTEKEYEIKYNNGNKRIVPYNWDDITKKYEDLNNITFNVYKNFISIKTKSRLYQYKYVKEGINNLTNEFLIHDFTDKEVNTIIDNLLKYSENFEIRMNCWIGEPRMNYYFIKLNELIENKNNINWLSQGLKTKKAAKKSIRRGI